MLELLGDYRRRIRFFSFFFWYLLFTPQFFFINKRHAANRPKKNQNTPARVAQQYTRNLTSISFLKYAHSMTLAVSTPGKLNNQTCNKTQ